MIERNVMQFWHNECEPDYVLGNTKSIEDTWRNCRVTRLNDESAYAFLADTCD